MYRDRAKNTGVNNTLLLMHDMLKANNLKLKMCYDHFLLIQEKWSGFVLSARSAQHVSLLFSL